MLKRFIHYTHIPQMRQDVSLPEQRPQRRKTPEAYQCLTRLTLSWPRPALAHGYVEDADEPRTKLGKGRVLARLGRTGEIDRAGEASPNSSCIGGVMVRRDHLNGEL
jgi:hypothetical protein